jgi:hypothetical protein
VATIDCPHGFARTARLGETVTWEVKTVTVCGGVCDSADLCGINECRFYDTSREATRRFQRANADSRTLEGMLLRRRFPDIDLAPDYERRREAWRAWEALGEEAAAE